MNYYNYDNVLTTIKSKKFNAATPELEFKLILDKSLYLSIFNTCKEKFSYEIYKTVSIIEESKQCNITKEIRFMDDVKKEEIKTIKVYRKKRLWHINNVFINPEKYPLLKMAFSNEEPLNSASKVDINLVRIKYRYRFSNLSWFIDITFVKTVYSKDKNIIKQEKDNLFNAPLECKDIELEFEHQNYEKIKNKDMDNLKEMILELINSNAGTKCSIEIQKLCKTLGAHFSKNTTLKQILPNAIEVNRNQYYTDIYKVVEEQKVRIYATQKIDGYRVILNLQDNLYFTEDECKQLMSAEDHAKIQHLNLYIEAEKYDICDDLDGGCEETFFFLYDICGSNAFDSQISNTDEEYTDSQIMNIKIKKWEPFTKRYEMLQSIRHLLPKNFIIKEFIRLTPPDLAEDMRYLTGPYYHNENRIFVDGIIFTKDGVNYSKTSHYKWKPAEQMSIDFVAKLCNDNMLKELGWEKKSNLYILFSGIQVFMCKKLNMKRFKFYNNMFPNQLKDNYIPIQFSPSDNPEAFMFWSPRDDLDGRIVELTYTKKGWKLLGIRDDRIEDYKSGTYYGNNFKVAEIIWRNFANPLKFEHLYNKNELERSMYFTVAHNAQFKVVREFNNMVKTKLLVKYSSNITDECVIDLCAGKGQDLYKYIGSHISNVLMIDISNDNICEIISRKYGYVSNKNFKESINIGVKKMDLTQPFDECYKQLQPHAHNYAKSKKYQREFNDSKLIVCHFAIHYFVHPSENLTNFIKLVKLLLCSGGRIIITCLNGQRVHDLLENGPWSEGPFYIEKAYKNAAFTGINQKIKLRVPFQETLQTECLVKISSVEKAFQRNGFITEYIQSFNKMIDTDFDSIREQSDKDYISLHSYLVFTKL